MVSLASLPEHISKREKDQIRGVLAEYASVRANRAAITPHDLRDLLWRIYTHEDQCAHLPIAQSIGSHDFPGDYQEYVGNWSKAFLNTLGSYLDAGSYREIVERCDDFRDEHMMRAVPRKLRLALLNSSNSLGKNLTRLHEHNYSSTRLGTMEAHWQVRRLAQLYYGLYSAERDDVAPGRELPPPDPEGWKSNFFATPDPDVQSYSARQRKRDRFTKYDELAPGQFPVDNGAYLALYIDFILDQTPPQAWKNNIRPQYEDRVFLMPGLTGIDTLFQKTRNEHGTILNGIQHLNRELHSSIRNLGTVVIERETHGSVADQISEVQASINLVRGAIFPSLCMINITRGLPYAGAYFDRARYQTPPLLPIVKMKYRSDIYTQAEIDHDWHEWDPVLDAWNKAEAKGRSRPRTPSKEPTDKAAIAAQKLKELKARVAAREAALLETSEEAQAKYEKNKVRRLRDQPRREQAAIVRQLYAEEKQARKTEEFEKEKAHDAELKVRPKKPRKIRVRREIEEALKTQRGRRLSKAERHELQLAAQEIAMQREELHAQRRTQVAADLKVAVREWEREGRAYAELRKAARKAGLPVPPKIKRARPGKRNFKDLNGPK